MRTLSTGLLLLLSLALVTPAIAQDADPADAGNAEAEALMKKVEAKTYSPRGSGLKDVKFQVSSPMLQMMLGEGQMWYYWKAAKEGTKAKDQNKLKITGGGAGADQNPMMGQMLGMIDKMITVFLSGSGLSDLDSIKKHVNNKVEKRGEDWVITVTPKADAPAGKVQFTKQIIVVDKDHKIKGMAIDANGMQVKVQPSFIEKDGKLLWSSLKMNQMGMDMVFAITWKQFTLDDGEKKVWLPSGMKQTMEAQGMELQFNFSNHAINKGIEDSVFAGK